MNILTVDEITEIITEKGARRIASDGWAEPIVSVTNATIPFAEIGFKESIQSRFTLEFVAGAVYQAGQDEMIRKKMARHIHNELYGPIISELHLLKSQFYYGDKEQAQAVLDALFDKLVGRE